MISFFVFFCLPKHTHRYYEKYMQMNMLPGLWSKDRFAFGGALLKGSHPKKKRNFRANLPLHVVMRSSKAVGKRSLFLRSKQVAKILNIQAQRHFIKLYAVANAGNHLHLLIQAPSQDHLSYFLRAIGGRIAQLVMEGAQKSAERMDSKPTSFWDARPFSRIVSWGRDFKNVARYIGMNSTEMMGITRTNVREMFEKIQHALAQGLLPKTPGLIAAGFV